MVPDSYDIDMMDVQSVVALNMKEKQLWFLKCLSILQRPWEVGKHYFITIISIIIYYLLFIINTVCMY